MLGDVVVAEPGARIGFAGPDVIRQTIRQELPAGFQTAEFLHRNGMVDLVVARDELRGVLIRLLTVHARALPVSDVATGSYLSGSDPLPEPSATEVLRLARHTGRPTTLDYCDAVFDDFVELHGDRLGADDPAVVIGVALLDGRPVAVLGHQKAHDTVEMVRRNFGMPQPAGYHKARRLMNHAERFGLPVITFVDTPGAFPGTEAEQRGQGTAIAEALLQMSRLRVPVISVITGEGGSGGALALAVGNRVVAMANSYLSVISPEGCSTILFGSAESADRAARALRITAPELLRLGVIDGVVPEPEGGAHADPVAAAAAVKSAITSCLGELTGQNGDELVDDRYARYQRFNPIETYQSAVEA
jgi:acyl-CoA carboxylase subunit beta